MPADIHIRPATRADVPALTALIEASVRGLGSCDYTPAQVESSLRHLFGVDTRLIDDGTYYAAVHEAGLVACGGWSRRRTPFGGDQMAEVQDANLRTPGVDAAVIRAFFVHPDWARHGLGHQLLVHCETAARTEGYTTFELTATLTGHPFYVRYGYEDQEAVPIALPDGIIVDAIRMVK